MPAVSAKQRMMMAIAEHHPNQLYKRNGAALKMSKQQLHDFASTKGLARAKAIKQSAVKSSTKGSYA